MTAGSAASSLEHEAMLDVMRRVSASLSAYRTKMELLKLPEYKRLVRMRMRALC